MDFAALLNSLGERPGDDVFVGLDRITRGEFADLVRNYAGGLRKRKARTVGLVAGLNPPSLAFVLAAIGMGVRVDLIDPRGSTELVGSRLELSMPDFVVATPGIKFALKGPKWVRGPMRLPDWRIWPEIVAMDDVGGAQVRRFGMERSQPTIGMFSGGSLEEPLGVVHTVASLAAGAQAITEPLQGGLGGPVVAQSWYAALAAFAVGKPLLVPKRSGRALARQIRRAKPSHCYLSPAQWRAVLTAGGAPTGQAHVGPGPVSEALLRRLLDAGADETWAWFGMAETGPVAVRRGVGSDAASDLPLGRLLQGVTARVDAGELVIGGASVAPRNMEGDWVDERRTGVRCGVRGSSLRLVGNNPERIWCGGRLLDVALFESRLAVEGARRVLLLGEPTGDGDASLVVLVEFDGGNEKRVRKAVQRRAQALRLPVAGVVFGVVPIRDGVPDRQAALDAVARR